MPAFIIFASLDVGQLLAVESALREGKIKNLAG